jgi:hypothetical protein
MERWPRVVEGQKTGARQSASVTISFGTKKRWWVGFTDISGDQGL